MIPEQAAPIITETSSNRLQKSPPRRPRPASSVISPPTEIREQIATTTSADLTNSEQPDNANWSHPPTTIPHQQKRPQHHKPRVSNRPLPAQGNGVDPVAFNFGITFSFHVAEGAPDSAYHNSAGEIAQVGSAGAPKGSTRNVFRKGIYQRNSGFVESLH